MDSNVIVISQGDNVGVALRDINENQVIRTSEGNVFTALSHVPYSHKVALTNLEKGMEIYKYGEVIGLAAQSIRRGQWVHTHNMHAGRSE